MKVVTNNEISREEWEALISQSSYASAFQTAAFYELFNSIPGLSAEAYAIEESSDIKAICVVTLQKEEGLRGYFSKRAIIYGGPVLNNNEEAYLDYLLKSIGIGLKGKSIYSEIRNLNDYSNLEEVFKRNGWQYLPYQSFIVDCSDKKKLFDRLGSNRKRQIKKATSSGVIIREAQNLNEINDFYSILQNLYKKKIKRPLLPKKFFEEFFKKNLGKCLIVEFKNKIIGGILCPILEKRAIYEIYICGLDDVYKNQYPSVIATWGAMEYANENNIPIFDFMGAGRKDMNYGVREFKARFGGDQVEFGRYLKIENNFLYKIGEIGLKLLKKL